MKTLYVSDLDGTLLNGQEVISDYSLQALNAMLKNGLTFTFSTARSLITAKKAVCGLNAIYPASIYNGACIVDMRTEKILHVITFNGLKDRIMRLCREAGLFPLVYSFVDNRERVSWLQGRETDGILRYLSRRKGDPRLHPARTEEELFLGDVFYVTIIAGYGQLQPLLQTVQGMKDAEYVFDRETYRTDAWWLEIMPKGATKAEAVKRIAQMLDCDKIVCFGDAVNDISMFRIADEAYAVLNAEAELKDVATGVIGYSEEDSVAKWLMANYPKEQG